MASIWRVGDDHLPQPLHVDRPVPNRLDGERGDPPVVATNVITQAVASADSQRSIMFVLRSPDRAVLDDREAIECDPAHTEDPILAARPRNAAGFHCAAFSFVGRLVPKVDGRDPPVIPAQNSPAPRQAPLTCANGYSQSSTNLQARS
jgi:hypothetical protein